jgi:hypothetical protein
MSQFNMLLIYRHQFMEAVFQLKSYIIGLTQIFNMIQIILT